MLTTNIFGRHGANSDVVRRLGLNGRAVGLSWRCGDSRVAVRLKPNRTTIHGAIADEKIRLPRAVLLNA